MSGGSSKLVSELRTPAGMGKEDAYYSYSYSIDKYSFTSCRENRYLLFLTENYAALDILHHYINMDSDGAKNKPYILFGSSFPKEKEYTQVYGPCAATILFCIWPIYRCAVRTMHINSIKIVV